MFPRYECITQPQVRSYIFVGNNKRLSCSPRLQFNAAKNDLQYFAQLPLWMIIIPESCEDLCTNQIAVGSHISVAAFLSIIVKKKVVKKSKRTLLDWQIAYGTHTFLESRRQYACNTILSKKKQSVSRYLPGVRKLLTKQCSFQTPTRCVLRFFFQWTRWRHPLGALF